MKDEVVFSSEYSLSLLLLPFNSYINVGASLFTFQFQQISLLCRIFCRSFNYAAPGNEHVGIIFRENCSEACFFTIKFLLFSSSLPMYLRNVFELKKETS